MAGLGMTDPSPWPPGRTDGRAHHSCWLACWLCLLQAGKITKFAPFSKYPPCYKDVSFWVDKEKGFNNNDFFEIVRGIGGDLVEQVSSRKGVGEVDEQESEED